MALFDRKLSPGGGMWGGAMMFNDIVVQEEAMPIVRELELTYKPYKDGTYIIEGPWLERLMANINFSDYESRMYFDKMLRQSGLFDRLEAMGIQDGDTVDIYDFEFEYQR